MSRLRKADVFFIVTGTLLCLLALTFLDAGRQRHQSAERLGLMKNLTRNLELTDLALFSEARYTRHLTQSDLHTPFQSHPFALEYFPSGSLVASPEFLRNKP